MSGFQSSSLAKKSKAFTLIELLVVVALLIIMMQIAVPAAMGLYAKTSIENMSNSLMEDLRVSRMHADSRQSRIALCAGPPEKNCNSIDWSTGWTIFYSDLEAEASSLKVIQFHEPSGLPLVVINGDLFSTGEIIFDGRGLLANLNVPEGVITFCHKDSTDLVRLNVFITGQVEEQSNILPNECRGA